MDWLASEASRVLASPLHNCWHYKLVIGAEDQNSDYHTCTTSAYSLSHFLSPELISIFLGEKNAIFIFIGIVLSPQVLLCCVAILTILNQAAQEHRAAFHFPSLVSRFLAYISFTSFITLIHKYFILSNEIINELAFGAHLLIAHCERTETQMIPGLFLFALPVYRTSSSVTLSASL